MVLRYMICMHGTELKSTISPLAVCKHDLISRNEAPAEWSHISVEYSHYIGFQLNRSSMFTTIVEFISALLILAGFELFNRKSIKGFYVMAIGQLLAMIICGYSDLWFLAFMHFVNFLMQIRGYFKWQSEEG